MSHCPGCLGPLWDDHDLSSVYCPGCGHEGEIAQLKAELASANAEAERLRGLGKQLRVAAGEPNCHLRALEVIQKAGSDLAALKAENARLTALVAHLQRDAADPVRF